MNRRLLTAVLILFAGQILLAASGPKFSDYFVKKTMRIDYFVTGTKTEKTISLDVIKEEPHWAGSCVNLIDTLNLGEHMVKVYDYQSDELLYSRGFNSLFKEWQTTDEAASGVYKTMPSSVLIPFPKEMVRVTISSRNRKSIFVKEFSVVIDPDSYQINRDGLKYNYKVRKILKNGSPNEKLDILILPDGYTKRDMTQFKADAKHLTNELFRQEPFKSHKDKFNVWIIEAPSQESGVDDPRQGIFVNTAFGLSYNTFDTDRYVQGFDNQKVRDVAAAAPYDQLYFLMNSTKYGGGGIFNYCSIAYARSMSEEDAWINGYVFVHEFGHALAGLADEYYSSATAYNDFYPQDIEPWERNITTLVDSTVKWKALMAPETPVPTPWGQDEYDAIDYRNTLNRERFLRKQPYWEQVGVFEGGGYSKKGIYRPYLDCIMFSKTLDGFCPVCQDALEKVILFYTE